jgi:hypothetical protein
MTILNYTPHEVVYFHEDGTKTIYESVGTIRLETFQKLVLLENNISFYKTIYGGCDNLPPEQSSTCYIVSLLVKSVHSQRLDFISPTNMVRDDMGNILGCKGFDTNFL